MGEFRPDRSAGRCRLPARQWPSRATDPNLARLALNCRGTDVLAASANYRQYAYELLATDSDAPNFTKDLPFYFDLYTFRGDKIVRKDTYIKVVG